MPKKQSLHRVRSAVVRLKTAYAFGRRPSTAQSGTGDERVLSGRNGTVGKRAIGTGAWFAPDAQ